MARCPTSLRDCVHCFCTRTCLEMHCRCSTSEVTVVGTRVPLSSLVSCAEKTCGTTLSGMGVCKKGFHRIHYQLFSPFFLYILYYESWYFVDSSFFPVTFVLEKPWRFIIFVSLHITCRYFFLVAWQYHHALVCFDWIEVARYVVIPIRSLQKYSERIHLSTYRGAYHIALPLLILQSMVEHNARANIQHHRSLVTNPQCLRHGFSLSFSTVWGPVLTICQHLYLFCFFFITDSTRGHVQPHPISTASNTSPHFFRRKRMLMTAPTNRSHGQ